MNNKKVIIILLLLAIISACSNNTTISDEPGAVASAHELATQAGIDILEKGGNAYDAAIAVAASLNVVEPGMSGIGGYGTILIYNANDSKIMFLNPSGRFPAKTNTDLMRPPTPGYINNRFGPKSISTPGNLNAWKSMHDKYGSLEWSELFQTAIQIAEEGFPIGKQLAILIDNSFQDYSEYSKSFYGKDNRPLKEGELLIQKDLADTYRQIEKDGPEPFYKGEIALAIDRQMKEADSFLSIEDLENNKAEWWGALHMSYRDYDVYTADLPANSFAAFVNLGIMQVFDSKELGHNSEEYLHLFAEMTKESYKARLAYSFDPEIREAPLDSLFSTESIIDMASRVKSRKVATEFVPPFSEESKNTTHFVVADKEGNIVSATQTLGNAFGSRIMVEGTGIWLNNSMAYSTFEPKGNPMDAFPGRHKLSGDCPVIILKDGLPWAALGTPGGHTITQNVPQIIFNLIDFDMSMQEAIDAPKICFVEPDYIRVDRSMDSNLIKALEARGHKIKKANIGNANGIKFYYDYEGEIIKFEAATDSRGR